MIKQLQQNLLKPSNRMENLVDQHRTEKTFQISDWVWMRLQPWRQVSVQHKGNAKLGPKYFGPFRILNKVGSVAYKLDLRPEALIHPTVRISQLKLFRGQLPNQLYIPDWLRSLSVEGRLIPQKILARRIVTRKNKAAVQYLV